MRILDIPILFLEKSSEMIKLPLDYLNQEDILVL